MVLLMAQTSLTAASEKPNECLWYQSPGKDWNSQALHLGNGWMGVSFFGDVQKEIFTLGEKSLWTGGPGDTTNNTYGIRPGGKDHIAEIRRLIVGGKITEADALYKKTMFGNFGGYGSLTSVGNLELNFEDQSGVVSNYVRQLDLNKAIGSVSYKVDNIGYHREYFCSYPARALVMRVTSDKRGALSFDIGVNPFHKKRNPVTTVLPERGLWELSGNIDDNNRPYRVKVRVVADGGSLVAGDGQRLRVKGANAATIFYTVATDYEPNPPLYRGADPEAITAGVLKKLEGRDYPSIRAEHVADYQRLYLRAQLNLDGGRTEREALPTDERWKYYSQHDYADLGFQELAFNFGKYLLISSSRPGSLPDGLQGAWLEKGRALCSGNYQMNINIPLIYMPGNVLGLSECNEPFMKWIEDLVIPGRAVAKAYYGTSGWVSHATGNIWGFAAPGVDIEWGAFPGGAAWTCRHVWEQYEFTQDTAALKAHFYPVMKEAAQFWLENLTEYQGSLIAIPSTSAEQRSPKGFLLPSMMDPILIRDLFGNVIKASEILGVDSEFRDRLAKARARLVPLKIGRLGQLQEWIEDVDDPNCTHRHFMHMMAVHPAQQINAHTDIALADAARVTMNIRGDSNHAQMLAPSFKDIKCTCLHAGKQIDPWAGGNWSRSWKCWIWARLLDGNRAQRIACEMLGEVGCENMCTYQPLGTNKPMQLDGSVTTPGFMAEMLMQSQNGEIELLPALPAAWPSGKVTGLRARGGFIVDLSWKDGKLAEYHIRSSQPRDVTVRIGNTTKVVRSETL